MQAESEVQRLNAACNAAEREAARVQAELQMVKVRSVGASI